jgi:hypothetical protein
MSKKISSNKLNIVKSLSPNQARDRIIQNKTRRNVGRNKQSIDMIGGEPKPSISITIGNNTLKVHDDDNFCPARKLYQPTAEDIPRITELLQKPWNGKKLEEHLKAIGGYQKQGQWSHDMILEIIWVEHKNTQTNGQVTEPVSVPEPVSASVPEPVPVPVPEHVPVPVPVTANRKTKKRITIGKEIGSNIVPVESTERINPVALGTEVKVLSREVDISVALPVPKKIAKKQVEPVIIPMKPENSNKDLFEMEKQEWTDNATLDTADKSYDFLYPNLNDPNFNLKIASRKEFNDTEYEGPVDDTIESHANKLCNAKFELMPHQQFVKNFLSFQTPYNSLLLYHGLGSGKTCSAIGIAEEMRAYMKQAGIKHRIMVVASPNVQSNFRLQLFDERKLEKIKNPEIRGDEGIWNIQSCIGNALLKEINPTNLQGLSKESVKQHVNSIINNYYEFMGYGQLANKISYKMNVDANSGYSAIEQKRIMIDNVNRHFSNRLIIIDEIHNLRLTDENQNKNKRAGSLLRQLAEYADNLRLLMLSATPMYNSHKEIIWLTNLMNVNDKRATIEMGDVFNKDGSFKPAVGTKEDGGDLLRRKLTGYVSYVRGENPYTFPYRIYPKIFDSEHSILNKPYPTIQMNGNEITKEQVGEEVGEQVSEKVKINYVDVYMNEIGKNVSDSPSKLAGQNDGYHFILQNMLQKSFTTYGAKGQVREMPTFENMEAFGYTLLQNPLEALNMVYPNEQLDEYAKTKTGFEDDDIASSITGKRGLSNTMDYEEIQTPQPMRFNFKYKPDILKKYGPIFNRDNIDKYSSKIANICDIIYKSTGIVLVYSQYIDGGVVPLALALEEMGFTRYGSEQNTKSLFKKPPTDAIDAITKKTRAEMSDPSAFKPAKYIMITGDKAFSPNNPADIKYATNKNNRDGEYVKVILISRAGSEGLDFKNIRQVHVLEPWYNMNRIEQIIGRGVRNLSHCNLPFKERNVEIYLHATLLENASEEAADLYVYRLAERKAVQIGKVTRILKQNSVDCILNLDQTLFSVDKMDPKYKKIEIQLSSQPANTPIPFEVGDQPHTEICDYMEDCNSTCTGNGGNGGNGGNSGNGVDKSSIKAISNDTYNSYFIQMNKSRIMERIRELFREQIPPEFETKTKTELSEKLKTALNAKGIRMDISDIKSSHHHFYTRSALIRHINIIKEYPIEQIYDALTSFINNKYEYLTDNYGRIGNLVNKGEIYMFRPIEINDEQSSVFDASVPVDYKRSSLRLEVTSDKRTDSPNKSILGPGEKVVESVENVNITPYQTIINQIIDNLANTRKTWKDEELKKNWYKHASRIIDELKSFAASYDESGEGTIKISPENIDKYIIYHNLNMSTLQDKLVLIKQLFIDNEPLDEVMLDAEQNVVEGLEWTSESKGDDKSDDKGENQSPTQISVEKMIKHYFNTCKVKNSTKTEYGFLLNDEKACKIFVKQNTKPFIADTEPVAKDSDWTEADTQHANTFSKDVESKFVIKENEKGKINDLVGFIATFKNKEMVFNIKDVTQSRNNKGARCDNAGKIDVIKNLNKIIGTPMYNKDNVDVIPQNGLCIMLEIIMQEYSDRHIGNRIYFMGPEMAIKNNIAKYSR